MRTLLGQLGLTQVRHVTPVRIGAGPGLVRQVYRQVEREFGVLAPPMALHSPAPPGRAGRRAQGTGPPRWGPAPPRGPAGAGARDSGTEEGARRQKPACPADLAPD